MGDYSDEHVLYIEDYQYLIQNGGGRNIKAICPFCHDTRSDKRDKALSINTAELVYHCHYCGAKGHFKSRMEDVLNPSKSYKRNFMPQKKEKEYVKPVKKEEEVRKEFSDSFLTYFKERGISESTLKEARITQEAGYIPKYKKKMGCIAFNFYLEDELINVKHRTRDKSFALTPNAQLIPYNINSISPDSYNEGEEKYAIITEGEIDCISYIECGYKHVVSMPNGANLNMGWLDDFVDSHFDKLDVIYVSTDSDRKGLEARDELIRRFGKEKCRIIDYPKDCKDINEVLVKHGREAVKGCFENFTELTMEGVMGLYDVEDSLDILFRDGMQKGATVGIPSVDEILSFQTGMLVVVTGVPTHGKTYLLNYLLVRLNIFQHWKTAFFSPEFYPVILHISQIMETLGGQRFGTKNYTLQVYEKMKEYVADNFFWIDPDDTDISSVLDRARYLIKKKGIKAFVIDPFNALTDKEKKSVKQDEYISEFLQRIRWFARKYSVAVFLVMHPTKMTKLESGLYPVCDLYNCKGASEIYDKADIGLTVWRNETENYAELHVTKIKFRHLGSKGRATFKFNLRNGRYVEIEDADTLRKSGYDISTMEVAWDNSNYILNKIQSSQVEMTLQETPPPPPCPPDMPFAPPTDDAPF